MNNTLTQLNSLRLTGMAESLSQQFDQPHTSEELSFLERLSLMVNNEVTCRDNRKMTRLLKQARLRLNAQPANIDYRARRGLSKDTVAQLLEFDWNKDGETKNRYPRSKLTGYYAIFSFGPFAFKAYRSKLRGIKPREIKKHRNLLIEGPTGTGKTFLACALGQYACEQGISVRYFRSSRLFDQLTVAHSDGSFGKLLMQLAKTDLMIIDDWGLVLLHFIFAGYRCFNLILASSVVNRH